jgi:hypothetical protein
MTVLLIVVLLIVQKVELIPFGILDRFHWSAIDCRIEIRACESDKHLIIRDAGVVLYFEVKSCHLKFLST